MSAEIKAKTGVSSVLVAGSGGIFEVKQDGKLLYSKAKTQRFPQVGEVAELIQT